MERPDWETYWDPLTVEEAVALFRGFAGDWWIAGGWAIDLFAGPPYREHSDVDVLVRRRHLPLIHAAMPGWELFACRYPGREILSLWREGESLPDEVHDIWCRPAPGAPFAMQFMVVDDDGERWRFRRDHAISGPLAELTQLNDGVSCLNPALQLLYKARTPRPKDERDFDRALPHLTAAQRDFLARGLRHTAYNPEWLERLTTAAVPGS